MLKSYFVNSCTCKYIYQKKKIMNNTNHFALRDFSNNYSIMVQTRSEADGFSMMELYHLSIRIWVKF